MLEKTHTLVPVALTSFSLLEEGPYEGVYNVGLVLLQPVAGPRNNVETEMIPDVEAACLRHLLLQEGVSLPPEEQDRRSDMILAQGQGARKTKSNITALSTVSVCDPKVSFPVPSIFSPFLMFVLMQHIQ